MHTYRLVAATAALAIAGSVTGAAALSASAAPAAQKPTVTTVAKKLVGPLSAAQAPDGTRYWTDDVASQLWKQSPGGQPTVVYQGTKKGGVESVSADGGVLRFTTGASDNSAGRLMTLDAAGNAVQLADIYAHEKSANPDKKVRYGFQATPKSCLDQLPEQVPGRYKGVVESHPYATATANGVTYVADAAANAVFAVSATGTVSTVSLIEPIARTVSRDAAEANGLPSCTVGKKYVLESVPTDVEVGPDGQLYVTSLGGGPEDGSLGANSKITRIDPATGAARTIGKGYTSLTGIAVSPTGDLYVADLFAGTIAEIKAGSKKSKTYVEVAFPAAVEWTSTGLLATINALPGKKPKGQVVTITP